MATFYKYAERDLKNQIDWSEVSKGFTDMLKTEVETREKKKADIEKATQETIANLSSAPIGQDENVTTNILNYASDSKEYLLMMNRLLKSGQLDPKQYTIVNQNLQRGTAELFDVAKMYQESYADTLKRANDGESNEIEVYMRSLVEQYGNFSKSKFYIDPATGQPMAGIPEKDPTTGQMVLPKDPNKLKTPSQLKFASAVKIDAFKAQDKVNEIIDSMGEHVTAEMKGRIMRTISDITQRKGLTNPAVNAYLEAEKQYVEAALNANPFNAQSILTKQIKVNKKTGNAFEFTQNPEDPRIKTGDAILVIPDPANPTSGAMIPKLTPEQFELAKDFMTRSVRIGLDRKEQEQYYEPPQEQEWKYRAREDKKEKENTVNTWGKVFTATTPQAKRDAIQTILGTKLAQERGLIDIDLSSDGQIKLIYADKQMNRTIPYDPNTITLQRWNELGNELHGVDDVLSVMRRSGGGSPTARMNTAQRNFTDVKASREKVLSKSELLNNYLGTVSNLAIQDNPTGTVDKLISTFGDLGFTFEPDKNLFEPDRVKITTPDGKKSQWFTLKGNIDAAIKKFIASAAEDEKLPASNIPVIQTGNNNQQPTLTGGNVR